MLSQSYITVYSNVVTQTFVSSQKGHIVSVSSKHNFSANFLRKSETHVALKHVDPDAHKDCVIYFPLVVAQ